MVELVNKARVWCGVMPRVGSKRHMWECRKCERVRRLYWQAIRIARVPVVFRVSFTRPT